MRLTLHTDYALRLMMLLAMEPDHRHTIEEVARRYGISRNLMKVAQTLVQAGFDRRAPLRGRGAGCGSAPARHQSRCGDSRRARIASPWSSASIAERNTCVVSPACGLRGPLDEALRAFSRCSTVIRWPTRSPIRARCAACGGCCRTRSRSRRGHDRRGDTGGAAACGVTDAIRRETGIDEAMIERLVRGFYRRVREDALIGPVFAARIGDWGAPGADVRVLVVGRADDGKLSRPAHAGSICRCRSTPRISIAGWRVRGDRARALSRRGAIAIERARRIAGSLELGAAGMGTACCSEGRAPAPPRAARPCRSEPQDGLPPGLTAYKRTRFSIRTACQPGCAEATAPRRASRGLIHVIEGRLHYRTFDPAKRD